MCVCLCRSKFASRSYPVNIPPDLPNRILGRLGFFMQKEKPVSEVHVTACSNYNMY